MTKITVLGSGSWGTALCNHLAKKFYQLTLWGRDEKVLNEIVNQHKNSKYFPDITLVPGINSSTNLELAVKDADLIVFVLPSYAVREVAAKIKGKIKKNVLIVNTAKGLEKASLKTLSVVIREELGSDQKISVLSGPSFAKEVLLGLPTAVTVASKDIEVAKQAANIFHSESFRVYSSKDITGVEFSGVVKNVLAIASGVVEGMGMGTNSRAALITRGLVEMRRLVVALGGEQDTVIGLSGLGDLLLTATGELSRNYQVGLRLGRGEELGSILKNIGQVAEGVYVAPIIKELAAKNKVEMPIVEQVCAILDGSSSVKDAVKNLLNRSPKLEMGGL